MSWNYLEKNALFERDKPLFFPTKQRGTRASLFVGKNGVRITISQRVPITSKCTCVLFLVLLHQLMHRRMLNCRSTSF